MVSDEINDAPSLMAADLGIAIGASSDVAIESAEAILVRNDPRDNVTLLELRYRPDQKMMKNLAWALGYNVVAILLAAAILAPLHRPGASRRCPPHVLESGDRGTACTHPVTRSHNSSSNRTCEQRLADRNSVVPLVES